LLVGVGDEWSELIVDEWNTADAEGWLMIMMSECCCWWSKAFYTHPTKFADLWMKIKSYKIGLRLRLRFDFGSPFPLKKLFFNFLMITSITHQIMILKWLKKIFFWKRGTNNQIPNAISTVPKIVRFITVEKHEIRSENGWWIWF
jgi:hypothetical protein